MERRGTALPADFRGSRRSTHPAQLHSATACSVKISADLDSGAIHGRLYIVAQEAARRGEGGLATEKEEMRDGGQIGSSGIDAPLSGVAPLSLL